MNNHGQYGRRAFAGFCDVYIMQAAFKEKVEAEFDMMLGSFAAVEVMS